MGSPILSYCVVLHEYMGECDERRIIRWLDAVSCFSLANLYGFYYGGFFFFLCFFSLVVWVFVVWGFFFFCRVFVWVLVGFCYAASPSG